MKKIRLLVITVIFILFSHYLVVFFHEYAHSFTAWLLGYKANPLALHYGGISLSNLFLLIDVNQNVNNTIIYALGHPAHVALIAFAGPGINILLFLFSFFLLRNKIIQSHFYLFYFLFFFNLMNLGNIYDYVPIRTFAKYGQMVDIVDIEQGLNLSPWWVYSIGGYLICFLIWQFFTKTLILAYRRLPITTTFARSCLMVICVVILFGYFGLPGFLNHGEIAFFISATSLLMIPGVIALLWLSRDWVKQ